jgi:hypothetical protein
VTIPADGSFSYTPAQNFAGYDTFNYRITTGKAARIRPL